jgi:hypothetical protein
LEVEATKQMAAYWMQLRKDHIADHEAKGLPVSELPPGLVDTDILTISAVELIPSDSERKWSIFFLSVLN